MNVVPYSKLLGYCGLLPFLGLPLLSFLEGLSPLLSQTLFIQYSAVILAFLGGVHWSDALSRTFSKMQMSVAMLPSLLAWLCLFNPNGRVSILLLASGFIFMLLYDLRVFSSDKHYKRLRIELTAVTVLMHFAMAGLFA